MSVQLNEVFMPAHMVNAPTTSAGILIAVRSVLSQALEKKESQVMLDAHLVADLGADSIDYLDITLRLGRIYGVRFVLAELFPFLQDESASEVVRVVCQAVAQKLGILWEDPE